VSVSAGALAAGAAALGVGGELLRSAGAFPLAGSLALFAALALVAGSMAGTVFARRDGTRAAVGSETARCTALASLGAIAASAATTWLALAAGYAVAVAPRGACYGAVAVLWSAARAPTRCGLPENRLNL